MRDETLAIRKLWLGKLLRRSGDGIIFNEHEAGEIGPALFKQACKMGLEGIVSKHPGTAAIRLARSNIGSRSKTRSRRQWFGRMMGIGEKPMTANTIQRETSFFERGCQYYIVGRFAFPASLNPVAGNLLHHAIEFMLKGALSKTRTLEDIFKYQHNLPKLWKAFKTDVGDTNLAQFDGAIAALHRYEDLRYPDDALANGMESLMVTHRHANKEEFPKLPTGALPTHVAADIKSRMSNLPKVKRYDLCLQDYDELIEAIFVAAKRNPRFFFNRMNLKAKEVLVEGNLAAGLLK